MSLLRILDGTHSRTIQLFGSTNDLFSLEITTMLGRARAEVGQNVSGRLRACIQIFL